MGITSRIIFRYVCGDFFGGITAAVIAGPWGGPGFLRSSHCWLLCALLGGTPTLLLDRLSKLQAEQAHTLADFDEDVTISPGLNEFCLGLEAVLRASTAHS